MGISGSFSDKYGEAKGSGQQSGLGSTSGQQSGTWSPNAAVAPAYSQISGMLNNMVGVPQGYFPGYGYVAPSAATQAGVNMGMSAMPAYQDAANLYGNSASGFGTAAGTAGLTALQQAGLNSTALGNYGFLSRAANVVNNPYVQNQLTTNAQQVGQSLREDWLPAINNGAQTVNAMGSSRQGLAQAQGVERAAQQLANTNAGTMLNAYQQGLGAQQNALANSGAMLANLGAPMNTLAQGASYLGQGGAAALQGAGALQTGAQNALGYGQTVEGYQQKALDDAINRYNYQYTEPYNRITNVGSVLNNLFQPTGITTGANMGTTSQQQSNANTSKGWGMASELTGGMKI